MISKVKKILIVATTALALLGLTACGKNSSNSASGDNGKVTIRFSWWGNDDRHKDTLKAIKKFEKKYPNIKVKAEYSGWDGIEQKMATQISGGTEADLMQTNYDWYLNYSPKGDGFVDLNKYKNIIDMSGYSKDILKAGTIDGKLNGIPHGSNTRVVAVNKNILNKYGVKTYPTTWDGWKKVTKTLPKGYYPVEFHTFLDIICYITQKTGKSFLDDNGKINYSQQEIKDGFDWYQDMVDSGVTPSRKWVMDTVGSNSMATTKEFLNGKITGFFDWTAVLNSFSTNLDQVNMTLDIPSFPTTENPKNDGAIEKATMLFSISKHSKHPKEAAKLLNFILNDPDGVKAMGISRGMPVNTKAQKILEKAGEVDATTKKAVEYSNKTNGVLESRYLELSQVSTAYNDVTDRFGVGEINSTQAAKQIITKVNAAVKQFKSKN
ncbi:ABC transporter substrate-binding protein [Lapidilactobacillus bayanensis]|uniref:ABC transporter substrate-binding protein n=1 Tax=Lapidilactobacillus bayanensis TaxID=2485998 RepID=UPI000F772FF5|nr:ABC transporter substrate-binding protein [Lapidilactobacillus bayanensis]